MNYQLTVKEMSSYQAILKDQENNLVYLPLEKLPKNLNIGQTLNLQINCETANPKNIIAKEILNELLGGKKISAWAEKYAKTRTQAKDHNIYNGFFINNNNSFVGVVI